MVADLITLKVIFFEMFSAQIASFQNVVVQLPETARIFGAVS
jgi:hypothetical protein